MFPAWSALGGGGCFPSAGAGTRATLEIPGLRPQSAARHLVLTSSGHVSPCPSQQEGRLEQGGVLVCPLRHAQRRGAGPVQGRGDGRGALPLQQPPPRLWCGEAGGSPMVTLLAGDLVVLRASLGPGCQA